MRAALLAIGLFLSAGPAHADSLYVRLVGQLDMPQTAHSVDAARDLVYIANVDTLRVASVADPTHPVEIGHLGALDFARGVAEIEGYVYVADCDASLRIISVADPAHPVEVGRCPIPDRGASIVVSGDYAFVGHLSGVRVISIVDPAHPTEVAHCQTGYPNDLDVSGSHLYVADGALRIISVADPTNPTEVGYHSVAGSINAVAVSGEFAYTASTDSAFRVISVVDPAHPTEVGRCRYRSNWEGPAPQDLGVSRGHAFLADWHGGLRIIDVADPASPKEVGHYDLGTSWSVSLNGDYVYFTADTSLVILQFYQLGDLDIDNDSLDVVGDTLRLRRWEAEGLGHDPESPGRFRSCPLGQRPLLPHHRPADRVAGARVRQFDRDHARSGLGAGLVEGAFHHRPRRDDTRREGGWLRGAAHQRPTGGQHVSRPGPGHEIGS